MEIKDQAKIQKMKKSKREKYTRQIEKAIQSMNASDKKKMDFAMDFLHDLDLYSFDDVLIHIEPLNFKMFQYFIFSMLIQYENWQPKKDRRFL